METKQERRKRRREERRKKKKAVLESGNEPSLQTITMTQGADKLDLAVEQILQSERTPYVTDEGYHFIRPKWHRYVYGGAKRGQE